MSKETQKLWSRRETLRHLKEAIDAMEQAERHYAHLTQSFKVQVTTELERLHLLRTRIEHWPVTADERYHARVREEARKERHHNGHA